MLNKKPKIAVIGLKGLPAFGGAAAVGENIIKNLKHKFDFVVYSISSHTDKKTGNYDNICNQIVFKSIRHGILNSLYYYLRSTIHALFRDYDAIHLHHRAVTIIIPLLRLKYPVLLTTHGMEVETKFKKYKYMFHVQDKLFLSYANQITTVSLKDYHLVNNLTSVPKENITYIPNGISEDTINRPPIKKENNIKNKNNSYLLFAAGRIFESKGCHLLLEALIRLDYKHEVRIIGGIDNNYKYKNKLKNLCGRLENVIFTDLIKDKKELLQLITNAKIFIYPSYNESMSMMILEVISQKTPLIIADIPENKDILDDEHVLFAKAQNVHDLTSKISWALLNYDKMIEKSENAQKHILDNYVWLKIAPKYEKIFMKIIDE